MNTYKHLLVIVLLCMIVPTLEAAPTLTFDYGADDKPIAGVKLTQTESDDTVTIYASDANGQITLPTTTNTYTLAASLAETGSDPISVQDALYILQHIVELRTLETDQIKAADINESGDITIQDALKVLQHNVELITLNQNLIFYDNNTGNLLSETIFNPGDTPNITVIRQGDANLTFDPTTITDHAPILTGKTTLTMDENETTVGTLLGTDADGDIITYSITGGADASYFTISYTGVLKFITGPDYENPGDSGGDNLYDIKISVYDGTNTTSQALTIHVSNTNDNTPVITSSVTFTAVENQTTVGTVAASDADGDPLTYTLTGTDASSFSISSSGVLTFDSAPDYETKTSYSVTVNVSDGVKTTTQDLTINVTNVNDISPVINMNYTENWVQRGTDIDGEAAGDESGWYRSISNDGNTIAIGAFYNDGNGTDSGHVRVFDWSGSAWTQRGSDIDGEAAGDYSGPVSISSDKNTLAIGATGNDGNGNGTYSGHVRVFDWSGSAWTQRGADIDGEAGSVTRAAVSLKSPNDGNTIACGA